MQYRVHQVLNYNILQLFLLDPLNIFYLIDYMIFVVFLTMLQDLSVELC